MALEPFFYATGFLDYFPFAEIVAESFDRIDLELFAAKGAYYMLFAGFGTRRFRGNFPISGLVAGFFNCPIFGCAASGACTTFESRFDAGAFIYNFPFAEIVAESFDRSIFGLAAYRAGAS